MRPANASISAREWLSLLIVLAIVTLFSFPTRIDLIDNFIDNTELDLFDSRMRMARFIKGDNPDWKVSSQIQLVGITSRDYTKYQKQFYNRTVYVSLLPYLSAMGAKHAIIDVLFDELRENDPLVAFNMGSPVSYIPYVFITEPGAAHPHASRADNPAKEELKYSGMSDDELENAMYDLLDRHDSLNEKAQQAHLNRQINKARQINNQDLPLNQFRLWLAGKEYVKRHFSIRPATQADLALPRATSIELPSNHLMLSAKGLGFINTSPDPDGVLRRFPLLFVFEDRVFPNLDLVYLCDHYGISLSELNIEPGKAISFVPRRNGDSEIRIPIDNRGQMLIYFVESDTLLQRTFSFDTLLTLSDSFFSRGDQAKKIYDRDYKLAADKGYDPAQFKDSLVVIGESYLAGTDIHPIPLASSFPLFAVHAQLVDNILQGRYLYQPSTWITRLIVLLIGLLIWLIINRMAYSRLALAVIGLLAAYHLVGYWLFIQHNISINLFRPTLTVVFGSIFLLMYRIGVVEKEDRIIRRFFDRMVSEEVVNEILTAGNRESILGAKRQATVMFTDIRGFTPLLEKHAAESILDILNEYYDRVSKSIMDNRGHVNKFIGDAVLGLFGVPQQLENAEWHALQSAIHIQNSIRQLNDTQRLKDLGIAFSVGIGLNNGEMVVGMVGGEQTKRDYTALGDSVNIAQRLEGLARDGEILISENAYNTLMQNASEPIEKQRIKFKKREDVQLKGKTEFMNVYEVICSDARETP